MFTAEKKNIEGKEAFYEAIEKWYNKILKYNVNIVLKNCIAKIGKEEIHKAAIRNILNIINLPNMEEH